jgi:hypothetical protein
MESPQGKERKMSKKSVSMRGGLFTAGVVLAGALCVVPAHAITINGSSYSISASVTINGSTWGFSLDPDGFQQTSFQMSYDTSLFAFNPSATGLLCDFSSGGDCPSPSGTIGPVSPTIQSITPGSPRPGTSYNISVDQALGLVTVNYDLSANPATGAGERNFFVLGLDALVPLSTGSVVVHNTPGTYSVNLLSASCTASVGGVAQSCGSSSPATGVSVAAVPEPSSIWTLVTGLGLLAMLTMRRQRVRRNGALS